MANVQASLRASVGDLDSPARVCSIINGMHCASIAADRFVTFFCGVLDEASTDGITEAEGPGGEEFGMERVAAFAKAHAADPAARINQQLLARVTEFCDAQFQDDATLLVLAVE